MSIETQTATLTARMDRIPGVGRYHVIWVILLSAFFLADVADIYVLSFAAPAIRVDLGLSVTEIGALTSYSFAGMFVGAILGGRLSDRVGRKRIIVGATLFYAFWSVIAAIAPNLMVLGVSRVLTGVGLQAVTGALLVYTAEMFPRRNRGKYLSIMLGVGLLGVPLVAWSARFIVPLGPSAWRWLFVLGAIGVVPALIALVALPESIRWHELNGQSGRASALVERLEREALARTGGELPAPIERPREQVHALSGLATRQNIRRVLVTSAFMFFIVFGYYGFNAWVPTLLVEKGYSATDALTIASIYAIAPFLGSLAALPVVDRWERSRTPVVLCGLIALSMVLFAFAELPWLLAVAGFAVTFFLQTNTAVIYTYLPEVFPTSLRGLGSGIANGAGRLAGIVSGFAVAAIFTAVGFTGVFLIMAVITVIAGVIVGTLGERTRGRGIDEVP